MSLTVTYNRDKKTTTFNGALGLASVETVAVMSEAGDALAEGTLCLHVPGTDTALAEWAVAAGECETDTRAAALTSWFAARPALECADFALRVRDADGNLLGAGMCPVVDSCAAGEDSSQSAFQDKKNRACPLNGNFCTLRVRRLFFLCSFGRLRAGIQGA